MQKEDLMNKSTGWMLLAAGTVDREKLLQFLDQHAATMPRITLRNAMEHFPKKDREHYLKTKQPGVKKL